MIFEGLHENDLNGVLIPVISIDEYHGKIDDSSIVISFFLTDPEAALDLSSFIESGPFEILDTDVSKAINEDGYYQVFIEMERTPTLFSDLDEILKAIESLSHDIDWTFMSPRTKGDAVPFTKDEMKHFVFHGSDSPVKKTENSEQEDMEEAVLDYLANSNASNVRLIGESIIIEGYNHSLENKFVTFSDLALVNHILGLQTKTPSNSNTITETVRKLSRILGHEWLVESAGQFILISSEYSPQKVLLLK